MLSLEEENNNDHQDLLAQEDMLPRLMELLMEAPLMVELHTLRSNLINDYD